jgi:transposase-like protein
MTTTEKKCPECGSTRIRVVAGETSEKNYCRSCEFEWTTPLPKSGENTKV